MSYSGFDDLTIIDRRESIAYSAIVVYPTTVSAQPTLIGPYTIEATRQAPIKQGKYPLVMISHGTGSSPLLFRSLATHLANHDFVVCMPEHPFNNRNNNERADSLENLTDRPRHIAQAIDAIIGDSRWKDHVDCEAIAAIGHSLGAYTVLALAGGHPHTKHQIQHDPQTKITSSQAIAVTLDRRIKALVLFAPAAGWFKSEGALSEVSVPVMIFSGEKDAVTPAFHAKIIADGLPDPARLTQQVVPNAGHFSFLTPFPPHMKTPGFLPANDPEGFDRAAFQEQMNGGVLAYLKQCLGIRKST